MDEGTDQRFESVVEDLRSKIQLIAESVSRLQEQQQLFRREFAQRFARIEELISPCYRDLDGLRIVEEWAKQGGQVSVDVIRQRHREPL